MIKSNKFIYTCLLVVSWNAEASLIVNIYPEANHRSEQCVKQFDQKINSALSDVAQNIMIESLVYDDTNGIYLPSLKLSKWPSGGAMSKLEKKLDLDKKSGNIFGAEDILCDSVGSIVLHLRAFEFYLNYIKETKQTNGEDRLISEAIQKGMLELLNSTSYALRSLHSGIKKKFQSDKRLNEIHNTYYYAYSKNTVFEYDKWVSLFENDFPYLIQVSTKALALLEQLRTNNIKGIEQKYNDNEKKRMKKLNKYSQNEVLLDNASKSMIYRNLGMINSLKKIDKKGTISSLDFIVGANHVPGIRELIDAGFATANNERTLTLEVKEECK